MTLFRTPLALDAAMQVSVALNRLAGHPPQTPVVFVVRDRLARRYHTASIKSLVVRLERLSREKRLVDVLDPHDAAETMQFAVWTREKPTRFNGVVLDGYQVYAVIGDPDRIAWQTSRGAKAIAPPSDEYERAITLSPPAPAASAAPPPPAAPRPPAPPPPPRAAAPPPAPRAPAPQAPRGPTAAMGGGAPPGDAGPRPTVERLTAHGYVSAPDAVKENDPLEVSIGLAAQPVTGVQGGSMSIDYAAGTTSLTLDVQVAASGFSAPNGWRRKLVVDVANPYAARCTVNLTALPLPADEEDPCASLLTVHYSYKGVPCGVAVRQVAIQRAPVDAVASRPAASTDTASAVLVNSLANTERADIVMRLAPRDDVGSGHFLLTFDPSPDLTLPAEPAVVSLGTDPASFARGLIDEVTAHDGRPSLNGTLCGQGVRIADQIPASVWDALRTAATKVREQRQRIPTLLLMVAEAHIPWELARFPDPLPDPALPPFLSAQFAMARWILSPNVAPVPSAKHAIDHIAVVTGQYSRFGSMQDLPFANAERQFLMSSYAEETIPLRADDEELSQLMAGRVQIENGETCGAELVHFALHGDVTVDPPPAAVLYLSNGKTLSSAMFLDSTLAKASKPFLFLNACKAGAPVTQLGDYAGFAGDCLRAGFTAMLAPFWSVEDDLAHDVAKAFYQTALAPNGESKRVGEVMTAIRAKYLAAPELGRHSTYMAYVFYGHPNLLLTRP